MLLIWSAIMMTFLARKVEPHGQLSVPHMRGCTGGSGNNYYCTEFADFGPNAVVGTSNGAPTVLTDHVICRNKPRESPPVNTFTAGGSLVLDWYLQAPHPGDCSLYVSYDGDSISDGDKKWGMIYEKKDCLCFMENSQTSQCSYFPEANDGTCPNGCPQHRQLTVNLPDWLPASENAIFHYEWFAVHPRESGAVAGYPTVELYTGCFDAKIIGSSNSVDPSALTGLITMKNGKHLPNTPLGFRGNRDSPTKPSGFPLFASYTTGSSPTASSPTTSSPTASSPTASSPTTSSPTSPPTVPAPTFTGALTCNVGTTAGAALKTETTFVETTASDASFDTCQEISQTYEDQGDTWTTCQRDITTRQSCSTQMSADNSVSYDNGGKKMTRTTICCATRNCNTKCIPVNLNSNSVVGVTPFYFVVVAIAIFQLQLVK